VAHFYGVEVLKSLALRPTFCILLSEYGADRGAYHLLGLLGDLGKGMERAFLIK
jgi:hypothetical protein